MLLINLIKVIPALIPLLLSFNGQPEILAQNVPDRQLLFIENKGQIIDQSGNPNPAVRFLLNMNGFNVQLRNNGFSYDVYRFERSSLAREQRDPKESVSHTRLLPDTNHSLISYHRIDINFEGANPACEIIAEDPSSDYLNYYTAGTPVEGIGNVKHFGKVTYRNLYPGIDLEYLAGGDRPFKYNVIVNPGA
ncbi:MAG: hypothetical protein ABIK52_07460, partial [Bacteroidota bacterium]